MKDPRKEGWEGRKERKMKRKRKFSKAGAYAALCQSLCIHQVQSSTVGDVVIIHLLGGLNLS